MRLFFVVPDARGETDIYEPYMLISWDTERMCHGPGFEGVRKYHDAHDCMWDCWKWIASEVYRQKGKVSR